MAARDEEAGSGVPGQPETFNGSEVKSAQELTLCFQRTWIWSSASTSGGSQLPVSPALRRSNVSELHRHQHPCAQTEGRDVVKRNKITTAFR